MVEESVVVRQGEPRVSTGNPSLDAMLDGGLVARRPYLVVGPSGTGKTTLGIQFLCDGVRRGERVLLVTLEEPPNEARVNHRALAPDLDRVDVFDAIPDIMRYERTPFKDIASVRSAVPFGRIPLEIRRSPELASVEVTITALEQMLRTEVLRRNYTRLVIDSLTALQYFCMKGFDPVAGAQSFLRFLSDLRVTTILTVEAPLEDVETPERMLARGEIRLFRWELDGQTVRAVGVEKFRGSSHDVRLHPYRIGPTGIDINLEMTISRDTRQIIEPIVRRPEGPAAATPVSAFVSSVTPLMDEVRDLILLGADVAPARSEIEAALEATTAGKLDQAQAHLSRMSSLVIGLVDTLSQRSEPAAPADPSSAAALQRVLARADSVRTGMPPTSLPPQSVLQVQLGALLSLLPVPPAAPPEKAVPELRPIAEVPVPSPAPAAGHEAPVSVPLVAENPPPTPPAPEPTALPPSPGLGPEPIPAAAADTPSMHTGNPSPPEPEAIPTTPEMRLPAVSRRAKSLPPPPKPRPSISVPRVPKSAPPPPPRRPAQREEPPPLPTATMPEWLTPVSSPTMAKPTIPPAHPSAGAPHPRAHPSQEAPTAPRKRRKPASSAAGKRSGASPRAALPHEPSVVPEGGPAPAGSAVPESPLGGVPTLPGGAGATSKPRRRAPRKRKAPPVVAVEVEPVSSAEVEGPGEGSSVGEPPNPSVPREG